MSPHSPPPERPLGYSRVLRWSGPLIAVIGLITIGGILLRPAAAQSPLAWWILHSALAPARVLPLIGIGIALGLADAKIAFAGTLSFGVGIAVGFVFYKPMLAPFWLIPDAPANNFMMGPIASLVAGLLLIGGRSLRPWLLPAASIIMGVILALTIVVTDPSLNDPTNRLAGVLVALWIVAALALSLRAFRYEWFEVAARIVGSWLIAIGLLYGGVAMLPKPANPVPPLSVPSPQPMPPSGAITSGRQHDDDRNSFSPNPENARRLPQ